MSLKSELCSSLNYLADHSSPAIRLHLDQELAKFTSMEINDNDYKKIFRLIYRRIIFKVPSVMDNEASDKLRDLCLNCVDRYILVNDSTNRPSL